MDSIADRLVLAAAQLKLTDEQLHEQGVTVTDLSQVAVYLYALAEHAHQVAAMAIAALGKAPPTHHVRTNVDDAFGHAVAMLDAAMHFAGEAERAVLADPDYPAPPHE